MSKKKKTLIICLAAAVLVLAGVTVYAATSYGTESDPLITKSYLDEVLLPELEESFQQELDSALAGSGGGSFTVLTLSKGQTVTCEVGCEILLRIGTASVVAGDTPGLVDTTTAGTLNNGGALTANHLYMVTIKGHGITATANTVKVLISGSYTVE